MSEDDARRISACLNACEGVSTEHLINNLPIRELVTRYNEALREIEVLKNERTGLAQYNKDHQAAKLTPLGLAYLGLAHVKNQQEEHP